MNDTREKEESEKIFILGDYGEGGVGDDDENTGLGTSINATRLFQTSQWYNVHGSR